MSDARLAIIISAVNQASRELKQIRDEVQGVGDAGKSAKKGGFAEFKDGLDQAAGAALKAYAAFKVVKGAIDKVYGAAKEGAELAYLEQRFDNLSRSIGTTKDALLGDLRTAVRGTKDDAELMSGALDMMALGLAKNHDETVRLTAVAGALGWNMDQLTLTITNESTKRLDSLGLSVESVVGRYEQLKNQGVDGQRAMMLAVVEAGEAMIDMQGHVGDSALGAYAKMEAAQANYFSNLKKSLAEGGSGWAKFWTNFWNDANKGFEDADLLGKLKQFGEGANEIFTYMGRTSTQSWFNNDEVKSKLNELTGLLEEASDTTRAHFERNKIDIKRWVEDSSYRELIERQINYWDSVDERVNSTNNSLREQKARIEEATQAQERMKSEYNAMNNVLKEVTGSTENASYAMTQWLNSQSGISTFIGLAKTYTVEMRGIAEKKEKIAQLQEIIKNQGGVFEGTRISAKQAGEQIEKLNGEIADAEVRMKNMVKEAVLGEMTKQIIEGTGTWAEKLELVMGMYEATGDISREAVQETLKDFEGLIAYLERVTGRKFVIGMEVNMPDTKTIDDWQPPPKFLPVGPQLNTKPVDDWQPTPVMQWVIGELDSAEIDNWLPSPKTLEVETSFDTSEVDGWNPGTKILFVRTQFEDNMQLRATGGTVTAAASGSPVSTGRGDYLWQEYGYPGEIFVPSMSGYILSKADASRAVAAGQSSAMDYGSFESAFENALTRVLDRRDLRAGYQQQPLRSAFENVRNW